MDDLLNQLAQISPSERILLLPHCLRCSQSCQAKYNQKGLLCAGCNSDCSVNRLGALAAQLGYKGVCVAPGGHLAVKFVQETRPRAIVAVACQKELEEGMQSVQKLGAQDFKPLIVIVPLVKDGCIDTAVDAEKALEIIAVGCVTSGVV